MNSESKTYSKVNVWDKAIERLNFIFDNFDKDEICFSFSGGKDSSVMVQLALEIAKKKNKIPIKILFIDLEAQYKSTIKHVEEIFNNKDIDGYWLCLPLNLRNAVSVYQPQWICWDKENEDKWVRPMPNSKYVINENNMPKEWEKWFHRGIEFEELVVRFAEWFKVGKEKIACGVGIRSDESLNRYRTIKNTKKKIYKDKMWTTQIVENVFNFYPIYDWKTKDIWVSVGNESYTYNKIYDFMYMQGLSIHEARICQPYGDDQRKGLNLFRQCEPETWSRIVDRVSGANFGNIYCKSFLLGNNKVILPKNHTWESYVNFLMATLPKFEAEWYGQKFKIFIRWWSKNGYPDGIPDEADKKLESSKKAPSWRRLAKVILKNDKICKSLSFGQTKNQYEKYYKMKEELGE